jgi:hypothetical protein
VTPVRRCDLVVGDRDALPPSTILTVEPHHGMSGRAGAGEEVEDIGIGLRGNEEAEAVFNSVQ